jgi:hypothetical protein
VHYSSIVQRYRGTNDCFFISISLNVFYYFVKFYLIIFKLNLSSHVLHIRYNLLFPTEYSKHETCKAYLPSFVRNKKADDQKKVKGEDSGINRRQRDWICRENRENMLG